MWHHFVGEVIVEQLHEKWVLHEPLGYVGSVTVAVPAGFVTDFASVPRCLWPIFPPDDCAYSAAAIVHDWLYGKQAVGTTGRIPISRSLADSVLLEAALAGGCGPLRARLIYLGVRIGGARAWRNGPDRDRQNRTFWLTHLAQSHGIG